jgi:hypothetical protein
VNFPWPPLHFGNFPVAFSSQEALLAVANKPAGEPAAAGYSAALTAAAHMLLRAVGRPILIRQPQSIQAALVNQVILVN